MEGGVVHQRGRCQADVDHRAAGTTQAFGQAGGQLRPGQAAVATDHHLAQTLLQCRGADGLADQDGRGPAETAHGADQEEHDVVGVRGGGQRRLAEEAPHPHRIHRTIQRLRDVAGQDRQGKQQEIAADRAGGAH
ncbi:hypothetical protein G6F61_013968 [Rhizopus arrhizus]|nr:hypothetical protein G6F61_013968 [Rhizopus arrhizus]